MTQTAFRFQLDKGSKKHPCPSCRQKTFVRYVDNDTKEMLPEQVGRCDRENSCGHHYTPKQYFTDMGEGLTPVLNVKENLLVPEVVDFMPYDYVRLSMQYYKHTDFATWLYGLFGSYVADKALLKYFIGRSKTGSGKGCIFWRIDKDGNVRTGKIMQYNPISGKRCKDIPPAWVHSAKSLQPFNFKLSFFGEHLLNEFPDKTIAIVESEKTAVACSILIPDMVWLATGGNSGCKWREWSVFNALKDRNVILFPDFGFYNRKKEITCYQEWSNRAAAIQERMNCKIKVSRVLEDMFKESERDDRDLADVLIIQENGEGLAMTADNYPAVFDLVKLSIQEVKEINSTNAA